ncbi:MAG: hypothetical protein C0582_05360 [Alphaproteobacteria bacterium]|nr:MAG: hypothetical protein C0582_05360 [Alphaproteobacteria bacterium]
MPQFQVETFLPQLFWLAVIFSLFYGLSRYVFVPKLQDLFKKRSEKIQSYLSEAETLTDQALALEQDLNHKRALLEAELLQDYEKESHALQEKHQQKERQLIKEMAENLHKREQDLINHEQKLKGSLKVSSKPLFELALKKIQSAQERLHG